jgi:hypothetical protein
VLLAGATWQAQITDAINPIARIGREVVDLSRASEGFD